MAGVVQLKYQVEGGSVLIEAAEDTVGVQRVARGTDGIIDVGGRLEDALGTVRHVAHAAVEALRGLEYKSMEVEFGVKLAAEAGAIIAKTSVEGQFTVRMSWEQGSGPPTPAEIPGTGEPH